MCASFIQEFMLSCVNNGNRKVEELSQKLPNVLQWGIVIVIALHLFQYVGMTSVSPSSGSIS